MRVWQPRSDLECMAHRFFQRRTRQGLRVLHTDDSVNPQKISGMLTLIPADPMEDVPCITCFAALPF